MSDVFLTFDELLGLDETWKFDPYHLPSIHFLYRAWCSVVFLLASSPAMIHQVEGIQMPSKCIRNVLQILTYLQKTRSWSHEHEPF